MKRWIYYIFIFYVNFAFLDFWFINIFFFNILFVFKIVFFNIIIELASFFKFYIFHSFLIFLRIYYSLYL